MNLPHYYHKQLEKLIEKRANEWASATKVTTKLTFEPKGFGGTSDKIGGSACRLVEIDKEINKTIEELSMSRVMNEYIIAKVPDERLRKVLLNRYNKYKSWGDIAEDVNVKYDWAKIEPIMLEMRNAGKSFDDISIATGVPAHSLAGRWHGKKMQLKCTRTNFRAARFDWDAVLPIMQEMRNNYEPWEAIAEKTGISRNALQNKWKSLGMVINGEG